MVTLRFCVESFDPACVSPGVGVINKAATAVDVLVVMADCSRSRRVPITAINILFMCGKYLLLFGLAWKLSPAIVLSDPD